MQLIDRIEKRRFVGREFLLFLWFESELLDATLRTREHGSFGLWLEKKLVLSAGKESTKIAGASPGNGREAKEALLRGQLPESAGIRIAWNDDETSLVWKAESMGVASLRLKTAVDQKDFEGGDLVDELTGGKGRRTKPEPEDEYEVFFERMMMTQELEGLFQTLYRDFLALRLSTKWSKVVAPALREWAAGREVDAAAYVEARDEAR